MPGPGVLCDYCGERNAAPWAIGGPPGWNRAKWLDAKHLELENKLAAPFGLDAPPRPPYRMHDELLEPFGL